MSGLEISRPWRELTADEVASVPSQLGVYEIAVPGERAVRAARNDRNDNRGAGAEGGPDTVYIGFAGGHELFGLRSALDRELNRAKVARFRFELTHGYLTRWEELLMVHQARYGSLPVGNEEHMHKVGRLTLDL